MKNAIRNKLKLYLVTDNDILEDRDFYRCIEDAIRGGVTMVQLREKDTSGKEFLEKAFKLREITRKYNIPFIINDRVDIAMICDADGVHVGQSDIDAKFIRNIIGKNKILGVSARNLNEAKKAKQDGADYIGVGAMYSTSTKLDAKSVSYKTVGEIKKIVDIPIVLIGGINLNNLENLKKLDCDGYAVVSSILKERDIYVTSKNWVEAVK
ncbi:thiamine phosphate synthase [Romboutsia lituseburensis]|uniref:thiamine phosphate synthase n=1 Tax=Romboutsia lituseburensis TaxID=1537 RepID=UPI00215B4115|nr:thiamine phosphate synthase [Romboutsia lituseburensis]MCR8744861.1 thiamine phosphate synthase [Romboutsia lituseburensis]